MPSAGPIPAEPTKLERQLPSPLPEPPTAQIPGPRATAFLNLYQMTLSTTLRTISYDNFAACFPTIATNAPENLMGLHKAMIERLEGFAQVCSQASYIRAINSVDISYSSYSSHSHNFTFSNISITIPASTYGQSLSNTITQELTPFSQRDFEALIRERNVIENLNALEELVQDASRRKARAVADEVPPTPYVSFPNPIRYPTTLLPLPPLRKSTPTLTTTYQRPHLLPPSQILAAHLSPTLASAQSQLNAKLQTTQSQNATLYQTILEQRAEIEHLMEGLEGCVRDLEEADGKLAGEVGGLNSVVREVREVEMGGV